MHKTIAIIGHVDHGKTALVKALTGANTDRLKEEVRRGLSIVLGFASLQTPGGWLHFIDAPGHADFVQTAASGLSGADAVLLAIAADEGPSQQTLEHLKLAQLFGIKDAVVALTKSDLVTPNSASVELSTISEFLAAHGFRSPEIVACSSLTMEGIDTLTRALQQLATTQRECPSPDDVFLPIDRVFSIDGAGTVVTGTLLGGTLKTNEPVLLQPSETACTVRGLQIAGVSTPQASAGARVAVNLRGVKAEDIQRGDVLYGSGNARASRLFDVAMDAAVKCARAPAHMEQVSVLHGTRNSPARVRLFPNPDPDIVIAQLEFQTPQIGFAGQRFVIRRPALSETVTGGSVLDPNAVAFKRNKALHADVLRAATKGEVQAIAEALSERDGGRVDLPALSLLSRAPIDDFADALEPDFKLVEDSIALSKAHIGALQSRLIEILTNHHRARPFRPQAPSLRTIPEFKRTPSDLLEHAVNALVEENIAERRLDGFAMVAHDPNQNLSDPQRVVYESALEHLRQSGLKADLSFTEGVTQQEQADLLELMLWNQHAVRLYNHALKQTLVLHSDAIKHAETALRSAFPADQPFKTGEAREALATNRKTIVPLLELFDTRGITVRDGNLRVLKTHQDREGACDPQDAA